MNRRLGSATGGSEVRRVGRVLVAAGAACALGVVAAPVGAWASPGQWRQLSENGGSTYPQMSSIDEPTLLRAGSQLQVAWTQRASSTATDLVTAAVTANGSLAVGATDILSGWATIGTSPKLASFDGRRLVVFTGQEDIDTANPLSDGTARTSSSTNGSEWELNTDSLGLPKSGGYGLDSLDNGGSLLTAGNFSSTNGVQYNEGFYADNPLNYSTIAAPDSGCCAYDAALARDTQSGVVWTAYYSNASGSSDNGILYAPIKPDAGTVKQAPGSYDSASGSSLSSDQRVAMAARSGGGVWIAYKVGYPTVTSIRLLEVTSGRTLAVPSSAGASKISLTAAGDGRLWVSWLSGNGSRLMLARTNPSVTTFGVARTVPLPRGVTSVWHTASDARGTANVLDLVVTGVTGATGSVVNVFHGQAVAPLKVTAAGSVRRGKTLTVTVTEAGAPTPGAKVTFLGATRTTNAKGIAKFPVATKAALGKKPIRAVKNGYWPGSTAVRVAR